MEIRICRAPARTDKSFFTVARARLLVLAGLVGALGALVDTGCNHNAGAPPSQSPGQKRGGGGW